MQILFDHQTFRNQRYGGISLYISNLINGINQDSTNSAQLTIPDFDNENLPKPAASSTWDYMNVWRMMPVKGRRISNVFSLYALCANPYDVFHATYYDTYFLKGIARNKPWTFTYHDMTHEVLGGRFPGLTADHKLLHNKDQLAQTAPIVITISELTKQDIVNHHQIDPAKIRVIHHGNPYEQLVLNNEPTASPFDFPYLLFVGNRWAYKNFSLCVDALAPLLRRHSIHLVCAGGGSFTKAETTLLAQNGVTGLVHHQAIRNGDLPYLYQHAVAFIFPSLYEGFGLPILEAFSCRCPCVLSNAGALPEVAGSEAAIYFDPDDVDSIATAVETVITGSDTLRNRLITEGTARLRLFSWQKTIDETVDVYRQLMN
ncbi:MAG: glycosyltransferase family 4 protein [Bacteroidetes bacterium]|nr:glycosyltransferase family 4 protein [Fibrella sp.]